jgi:hypothetical protein
LPNGNLSRSAQITPSRALRDAVDVKERDRFIGRSHSNSLRSAKFVSEVADRLFDFYKGEPGVCRLVQPVDKSGQKGPGEWLFDISIVESVPFLEGKNKPRVNTTLIWAVESEYSTRRQEFARDFGETIVRPCGEPALPQRFQSSGGPREYFHRTART